VFDTYLEEASMMLRLGAWLAAVGLSVAFVGLVPEAKAADATATGTWKWEFKRQNGDTIDVTLKLKQDGEKLTGTISGPNNSETEIMDGMVKDGEVTFKVVREFNGNTVTTTYKGKLEKDTIKGTSERERDGQKQSRDWEAKREAA
jgi:hypothetical protein